MIPVSCMIRVSSCETAFKSQLRAPGLPHATPADMGSRGGAPLVVCTGPLPGTGQRPTKGKSFFVSIAPRSASQIPLLSKTFVPEIFSVVFTVSKLSTC